MTEPVLVTTAGLSDAADRRARTRRYLISQGIRVACVLLAVALPVAPVWKIGFIAASIILPWFGVIAANGGPALDRRRVEEVAREELVALPVASSSPYAEGHRVIEGER